MQLRTAEQRFVRREGVDPAVRHEHRTELEPDEPVEATTERFVRADPFIVGRTR